MPLSTYGCTQRGFLLLAIFVRSAFAIYAGADASGYQVVERGEDFAVFQKVTSFRDAAGQVKYETNRFTRLENAMHYYENEQWKPSEDLIESYPGGAVALRGPHKAIFSADLNSEAVFDILCSDGNGCAAVSAQFN